MVEDEGKSFVVKMLDLCKNSEEAVSLLTTDNKLNHYFKPEVWLLKFFDSSIYFFVDFYFYSKVKPFKN